MGNSSNLNVEMGALFGLPVSGGLRHPYLPCSEALSWLAYEIFIKGPCLLHITVNTYAMLLAQ